MLGRKKYEFDGDQFSYSIRRIMESVAEPLGLDYSKEYFEPSPTAEGAAFQVAFVAAHVYLEMNEPASFPARDQHIAEAGAEAVTASAGLPGAREATIYLANAVPLYFGSKTNFIHRFVDPNIPESTNHMADFALGVVTEVMPLEDRLSLTELVECFDAVDLDNPLTAPELLADEWRIALESGEDPVDDLDTVFSQLYFAKASLIWTAREMALELGLGAYMDEISSEFDPFKPTDPAYMKAIASPMVYWDELEPFLAERLTSFSKS